MHTLPRLVATASLCLLACVNTPEHFKPAGFATWEEAQPFIRESLYFARKLTPAEWNAFYARFPEFHADMQRARAMPLGGAPEFHPAYTAYAFRWNLLRRRESWPPGTVSRLERRDIAAGDDIFYVVYALGPPERVLHDNNFEVLFYPDGRALLFKDGHFGEQRSCPKCYLRWNSRNQPDGFMDEDVIRSLGLVRPQQ